VQLCAGSALTVLATDYSFPPVHSLHLELIFELGDIYTAVKKVPPIIVVYVPRNCGMCPNRIVESSEPACLVS
jgi:hypothetical protein